jgi:hypothetical protein
VVISSASPFVLPLSAIAFGTFGTASTISQSIVGTTSSATTFGLGVQFRTDTTPYAIWIDAEL